MAEHADPVRRDVEVLGVAAHELDSGQYVLHRVRERLLPGLGEPVEERLIVVADAEEARRPRQHHARGDQVLAMQPKVRFWQPATDQNDHHCGQHGNKKAGTPPDQGLDKTAQKLTEVGQQWSKKAKGTARDAGAAADLYLHEYAWTSMALVAAMAGMLGYLLGARRR